MRAAARIFLTSWIALAGAGVVHAKELAAYRAGDVAEADIATPVALDVVNPEATAARTAAAAKIPAIFCDFPHAATNAMVAEFQSAFSATRARFLAAIAQSYHKPVLDAAAIGSTDFSALVTNFNAQSKTFPVPTELAAQWARGADGLETQTAVLGRLLQIMRRPVHADEFPAGFILGDKARFVAVSQPDETPSLAAATQGGKLIAATNLTTLARLRMLFRHGFPKTDQAYASALAEFLQPVCAPAVAVTQAAREQAGRDLAITDHYAAGQTIVRRGAVLDAKALAALEQLAQKAPTPVVGNAAAVAAREVFVPARSYELWLLAALVVVSLVSFASIFLTWRSLGLRREIAAAVPVRVESSATGTSGATPIDQAVKAAVVQELAAMRVELAKTQPSTTNKPLATNGHADKSADTLMVNMHEHCLAGLLAEGQALLAANELEKALKCYDTVLTLHPDHAEAFVKMGSVLEKLGRNDEAFASYDCAIAVDDSMTVAYLHKGGLCNRLARYEEATRCYEKALLKPEQHPA